MKTSFYQKKKNSFVLLQSRKLRSCNISCILYVCILVYLLFGYKDETYSKTMRYFASNYYPPGMCICKTLVRNLIILHITNNFALFLFWTYSYNILPKLSQDVTRKLITTIHSYNFSLLSVTCASIFIYPIFEFSGLVCVAMSQSLSAMIYI